MNQHLARSLSDGLSVILTDLYAVLADYDTLHLRYRSLGSHHQDQHQDRQWDDLGRTLAAGHRYAALSNRLAQCGRNALLDPYRPRAPVPAWTAAGWPYRAGPPSEPGPAR